MSHMTSLLKAEKHAAKGSVLVATAVVAAMNAQAPTGKGASTSPVVRGSVLEDRMRVRVWGAGVRDHACILLINGRVGECAGVPDIVKEGC
jgi:hypothetical protein